MRQFLCSALAWSALWTILPLSGAQGQVAACRASTECSNGKVCGVENAQYFAKQEGGTCWPAQCQALTYQCANCGSSSAACGECPSAELCSANVRELKVRFWNLEADDGSGAKTGTTADRARSLIDPARTQSVFELADETVERSCTPTGKVVQGTFDSVKTAKVPAACLSPAYSSDCLKTYDAITEGSRDFLNVIWINAVGGTPGAFARGGISATTQPPWVATTGATDPTPFSLAFLHELGHVMLRGYAPLNQNPGDHIPGDSPLCEPQAEEGNFMCDRPGLSITAEQCSHMFGNEVVAKTIRQRAVHASFLIDDLTFEGAPPGNYRFRIDSPTAGYVYLMKDGREVARSGWYSWNTKISPTQAYTFYFPGFLSITLLSSTGGTHNLYNLGTELFNNRSFAYVAAPTGQPILPGRKYEEYFLSDVRLQGAPAGDYTFTVTQPTSATSRVTMKRNGAAVKSVDYQWKTIVSNTTSYTFAFPGYLDIVVRADRGTINLAALTHSIFDGKRRLRTSP